MKSILQDNIAAIQLLCKKHHIARLYAFGSVTDDSFSEGSDVDLLYEMDYSEFDLNDPDTYCFDPFDEYYYLKENLEALFKRKVDLIANKNFRNEYFRRAVERSKVLLYANERYS